MQRVGKSAEFTLALVIFTAGKGKLEYIGFLLLSNAYFIFVYPLEPFISSRTPLTINLSFFDIGSTPIAQHLPKIFLPVVSNHAHYHNTFNIYRNISAKRKILR